MDNNDRFELNNGFCIGTVRDDAAYTGLRDLWCRVFGDEPDFVDHLYEGFGGIPDSGADGFGTSEEGGSQGIEGYVVRDAAGKVVSALTCYRCGTYAGKDVYVSYAVCTDPEYRGLGLAGRLTSYVKDIVTKDLGALSIVSPASPELIGFYEGLGYRRFFCSGQGIACAEEDAEPDSWMDLSSSANVMTWDGRETRPYESGSEETQVSPGCTLTRINSSMFNNYRENFLACVPHITLSDQMTEFVKSLGPDGAGFYLINKGDAICAVEAAEQDDSGETAGEVHAYAELLVNPRLKSLSSEIEEELASELASALGADQLYYRMPGDAYCQSMIAGEIPADEAALDDADGEFAVAPQPYFGFPID